MLEKLRVLWRNLWILAFVVALGAVIAYGFSVFVGGGRPADTASLAAGATPQAGSGTGYPAPGLTPMPTAKVITDPALVPSPPSRTAPTVVVPDLPPLPLPASTYISKEVVLAKRGADPGEIGIDDIGHQPGGPTSFTVDSSGVIYVLDQINKRINKYDGEGKPIGQIGLDPSIQPMDIAVWRDGTIFLADQKLRIDSPNQNPYQTVHKLDPAGKPLLTYRWYRIVHLGTVRVDDTGVVWGGGWGLGVLLATQLGTVEGPFDKQRVASSEKSGFADRSGVISCQLVTNADQTQGYVNTTFADGRSLQLQLPTHSNQDARFAGTNPIGTDKAGNIYQDLGFFYPGAIPERHILVYNASGKLLAQAQLPNYSFYAVPEHNFFVDEQGRLYEMVPMKNVTKIIRWDK